MLQLISKWLQKASWYSSGKFHSVFLACSSSSPPDKGYELIFSNKSMSLFHPAPLLQVLVMSHGPLVLPKIPVLSPSALWPQVTQIYCNTGWGQRCKHSPRSLLFLFPFNSIMVYWVKVGTFILRGVCVSQKALAMQMITLNSFDCS